MRVRNRDVATQGRCKHELVGFRMFLYNRKLALVGIIPYQFFSFFSDKEMS